MFLEYEFDLNPEVAHREVEGQWLLLTPNDDVLYTLNGTGRVVWEMLLRRSPVGEIAAHLATTYGISIDDARRDTGAFMAELERLGVVTGRR